MAFARELPDRELKDRQKQLYGESPSAGAQAPRKAFAEFLKETPAAPLSPGLKAALIAAAVVVGLAFLASLYKGLAARPRPARREVTSLISPQSPQTAVFTANDRNSEWMQARFEQFVGWRRNKRAEG
ncbi:MAG: hypothetical protein U0800_01210 [Isosphaeraceae bacterium]